jgi:hypothetical protein
VHQIAATASARDGTDRLDPLRRRLEQAKFPGFDEPASNVRALDGDELSRQCTPRNPHAAVGQATERGASADDALDAPGLCDLFW